MEGKVEVARFLANKTFVGMSECDSYGMTWGCDIDCPVLRAGQCELKDNENKDLYAEYLNNKTD